MVKKVKSRLKIGLALGGGSARGITHIGVLKVLHQNKIYPDYIAGTSMGAIIGALYAAGHSPDEIEYIFKHTDWNHIFDFTIPKSGIIKGHLIEQRIKKLTYNKRFEDLKIPLKVIAVDIDAQEKVVFSKGNLARAVRASSAIPGIFTPVRIDGKNYVDGGLIDPTPFDVVKEMGADIIIAIDLFQKVKTVKGPEVTDTSLFYELKKKFIADEILNLKHYLTPQKFPEFLSKMLNKLVDRLLYPHKILKILAKKERLPIVKILHRSFDMLTDSLAEEKLKQAKIDILITPEFGSLGSGDFDKSEQFIKIGEIATIKKIPELKRILNCRKRRCY